MDWEKFLAREAIKRVDKNKDDYSLLGTLSFIPFIKDARTLKGWIKRGNLKATIIKGVTEEGDRYNVKGSNIISCLEKFIV